MRFFFRSVYRYRARAKGKKKSFQRTAWIGISLIFFSAFTLLSVLFPDAAGLIGQRTSDFFYWLTGFGRYLVPFMIAGLGYKFLFRSDKGTTLLKIGLATIFFAATLSLFTLLGEAVWATNYGGVIGLMIKSFVVRIFGSVGGWIVTMGLMSVSAVLLAGSHPGDLLRDIVFIIKEDWQDWKKARKVQTPKETKPAVVPPVTALKAAPVTPKPLKIMGGDNASAPTLAKVSPEASKEKAPVKTAEPEKNKDFAIVEPKLKTPKDALKAPAPVPSSIPYKSPSLDIFDDMKRGTPVPKEELTAKAKLLETTLANFNIAANVVEIHPGPVITRYDLEPAPGVKVSSISSRADDLALALRSTGIRVLAPIPGKGAVGIEIPNSSPESVGLKELLAKPEFFNHPSPLAFVVGKTVSGEPYVVDLAALPHILVAGATGAGKSVCVHAMICSILYRMPPDLVKFVLIDPKRLELPSYASIPHLYDPRVSPIDAAVITNSKQAAKALTRLVKVMEYRYDLFSKANVRNIDSYNKKQKAANLPPIHFLVVIIDELADLMLTSPKEVEDSIQRLAQMARAVGIHLVLATQRPSVDVITGVIKANLPSRIALRVASAIDSRVIVDCVGAESLLGKGDMLFLPPASPEPIRVQGAYVSEKEVENLVNHVKQFGMPQYDDLFGSGSALEFAVEDKKEMKDLIEALKLVLERRRVSQDLLKAQFGSSARATNILSLLEVKQFIHKPEGSNRWEINFDMIEDFLAKVNNIPENEVMS